MSGSRKDRRLRSARARAVKLTPLEKAVEGKVLEVLDQAKLLASEASAVGVHVVLQLPGSESASLFYGVRRLDLVGALEAGKLELLLGDVDDDD